MIADLTRKDFVSMADFTEEQACSRDSVDRFTATRRAAEPLASFLCRTIDIPF